MTAAVRDVGPQMLSHLPAVGLDELVQRASLLTRVDRKYIVDVQSLPALIARLDGRVRVLDIDAQRQFAYESQYFDTPGLDSYLGGAHRRRRRFKLRIRRYVDTDARFLEIKIRGARGATVKSRVPYDGSVAELSPHALQYAHSVLTAARIDCDLRSLAPSLTTRYDRATLLVDSTNSRITLDRNLLIAVPSGRELRLRESAIVESKAPRGASEVDRALWALGHRPCSISKYATGLAALRPDLPANHWHSTLQRHFADTPRKAHHA